MDTLVLPVEVVKASEDGSKWRMVAREEFLRILETIQHHFVGKKNRGPKSFIDFFQMIEPNSWRAGLGPRVYDFYSVLFFISPWK